MPMDPGRSSRVALIGETYDQARDVMVFGPSGIMACVSPDRRPVWEATKRRLVWPNGAIAQVFSAQDPEALRGPQFDAAWLDEIGCPAVDKGTNQPNVFLDDKSSESALPRGSTGRRDDLIQWQYLTALLGHWGDAANNPISPVYSGPMVDASKAFVWAWDMRPYPYFPTDLTKLSDGENYARGHWLNGRMASRTLASVVKEICASAGVTDIEVSELYGLVKGYAVQDNATARAALQPLMLAYGFDAIERDGTLVFRSRTGAVHGQVTPDQVAVSGEVDADIVAMRGPEAETAGRLRLNFIESEGAYEIRATEAIFADESSVAVTQTDLPLVLGPAEAQAITERWLAEARIGRDRVRFALPPSALERGAGDVVALQNDEGTAYFRIDQVEAADLQVVDAIRIEREVQEPSDLPETLPAAASFVAPLPVFPLMLDLPLISGDEVPHAPHIAVTADPWSGAVNVFRSATENGFALDTQVTAPATIGETLSPLVAAAPGLWDNGPALRVKLSRGALLAASQMDVLNGANIAAIGDGVSGDWEVFQFAGAELVDDDTFDLTLRLRGQAGTEPLIPSAWPVGSRFVLIDGALRQSVLPSSARGLARNYRIGPAALPYDHASYVQLQHVATGVGLRPYAPAHLAAEPSGGDLVVTWVRRTRIDGDSWEGTDVPLGESTEAYRVQVIQGGTTIRDETVGSPTWTYTAADQAADGVVAPYQIDVAQISDRFGPGFSKRIDIDG